jgi:hypothetical protein
MSLEKQPAGAFNKAQRLIEQRQYILFWLVCKRRTQFTDEVRQLGCRPGQEAGKATAPAYPGPYEDS